MCKKRIRYRFSREVVPDGEPRKSMGSGKGNRQSRHLPAFLALFLLLATGGGCSDALEEPAMWSEAPLQQPVGTQGDRYLTLSRTSAELGWKNLHRHLRTGRQSPLRLAAACFNSSWRLNPQNHRAHWGWGLIRELQAKEAATPQEAEKLQRQSIDLLYRALEHNPPSHEISSLELDLANVWNGLAALYQAEERAHEATVSLDQAEELIIRLLQREPENGRAYFLLSINYFSRNNPAMARENARRAQQLHYEVPREYLNAL